MTDEKCDESKALRWLHYLAAQLSNREETQFFIEDLRLTWLPQETQRRQKRLNRLFFGSAVAMTHYLLRWTMSRQNLLPLYLVPFLNDMAAHLLLQNAGAYFRFFHRPMQEHIATLNPQDIDRLISEIKTSPSTQ